MLDPTVTARFTRKDYDLLPESFPAQLVRGQLVKDSAPTYGHAHLTARLWGALQALVGPERALHSPVDVAIDDFNVFQPDLVVIRTIPPLSRRDVGIPLLAIEVLSPSTAKRDRTVKLHRLLAAGAGEVWIVDPVARVVEAHAGSETGRAAETRRVTGAEALESRVVPGFRVVPDELFRPPDAR
jgi:Uma2 family endonuclease